MQRPKMPPMPQIYQLQHTVPQEIHYQTGSASGSFHSLPCSEPTVFPSSVGTPAGDAAVFSFDDLPLDEPMTDGGFMGTTIDTNDNLGERVDNEIRFWESF